MLSFAFQTPFAPTRFQFSSSSPLLLLRALTTLSPRMSAEAEQYLADHKIHELMEFLCAQLVYAQPADPTAFLAAELRALQAKGGAPGAALPSSALSLFSAADFTTMFSMLDPLGKGTLSAKQVHKAVSDLGLNASKAGVDPTVQQSYNLEAFKKICEAAQ